MLQLAELRSRCNALAEQFQSLWGRLDLPSREARLQEIETLISSPEAWADQEKLTPVLREKSRVEAEVARYRELKASYDDMEECLGMISGEDDEFLEMLDEQSAQLEKLLQETEMTVLLGGEADRLDALLDIHPGAGGTEAQDWAEMLERMYLRWAELHHFKTEIVDYLPGDEAGIKSVTIRIQGDNAYGLLQGEKGIHRLIRISPYDASGRRHTSFASVDLIPDAGEILTVDIKESDLRIDVYRSSGAGGQHVNKTESAVRITHLPTGIVAQCQNQRSQQSNRESAMRVLRARLYAYEQSKRDAARQADYAGKDAIAFGSQIRTYTLQPYRLVKDHRTGCECGDVDAVLNGEIDAFLRDYLLYRHTRTQR
ncbi:peptide chain release factor 2 [uncultured Mailhella sp.]|uniref:peptide chain release factor 2 n=1 Tax=uncultured Mailhella sp. TaxID=1981031 RepID=UPI002609BF0D|nr:peptide chain release factor 2 [uncultured Mailhella sp.]